MDLHAILRACASTTANLSNVFVPFSIVLHGLRLKLPATEANHMVQVVNGLHNIQSVCTVHTRALASIPILQPKPLPSLPSLTFPSLPVFPCPAIGPNEATGAASVCMHIVWTW